MFRNKTATTGRMMNTVQPSEGKVSDYNTLLRVQSCRALVAHVIVKDRDWHRIRYG